VQALGGPPEVQFLGDGDERSQLGEVHAGLASFTAIERSRAKRS
jgi:hypothetical protein